MLKKCVYIVVGILLIGVVAKGQVPGQNQAIQRSQIVDDTTHLDYGPKSTKYTTEHDLRFNLLNYHVIDTALFSVYRRNKVEEYTYYYQNLGIEGSAMRPLYYHVPENIGVSPGQNGFAPYYKSPDDIYYYDTRSPFSRLTMFLGGNNRAITDVEFSRNDSVNVNFGFDFKKYAIDKQIERQGRGDRQVNGTQYDIYTQIRSSNLKYQLMANFTRSRHIYFENGGIDTTEVGDFYDEDVTIFLSGVESDELRQGLHLYHQYAVKDFLEVYNSVSTYRQRNEYKDLNLTSNSSYYKNFFVSNQETLDSTDYKHTQIELGLKGSLGNLYYNGYLKERKYKFINKYAGLVPIPFDTTIMNRSGAEQYYGFHAGYKFFNKIRLMGGLEILKGGNYEAYGQLSGNNFNLIYKRGKYKPAFLQQAYFGNHRFWVNNFRNVSADSFDGEYTFNFGKVVVTPTFGYDQITDYIYFAKDTLPAQNNGNATIMSPGLKFKFQFLKHFGFDGGAIYTILGGVAPDVMAIPEILAYSRLYYHNLFFSKNLETFIGLEGIFRSAYFGPAYDPVTQQYYLQDQTLVEGIPLTNLIVNLKIRRAALFMRMNNLTQMIRGEGYMVAPLYRGLPPTTDFGVTFWFFD